MAAEHHNGMQCNEFDALLSDALDKILTGPKAEAFQAHAKACPVCGPLLAEAEIGKHWLEQLVDVEPRPCGAEARDDVNRRCGQFDHLSVGGAGSAMPAIGAGHS